RDRPRGGRDVGGRRRLHLVPPSKPEPAGADRPALGVQRRGCAGGGAHVARSGRLNTPRTATSTIAAHVPITSSIGIAECGPARPVSGETTAARPNWAAPSSADPDPERPRVA